MLAQDLRLVGRRNVQHMEAVIVADREIDRPLRGDRCGGVIANAAVVGEGLSAFQPSGVRADGRFVFAMGGDRQRRLGEDAFQGRLLIDEQIPRAGADEDLDAGRALRCLQLGDVVGRRPDVEAVVHDAL